MRATPARPRESGRRRSSNYMYTILYIGRIRAGPRELGLQCPAPTGRPPVDGGSTRVRRPRAYTYSSIPTFDRAARIIICMRMRGVAVHHRGARAWHSGTVAQVAPIACMMILSCMQLHLQAMGHGIAVGSTGGGFDFLNYIVSVPGCQSSCMPLPLA